MSNLRSIMQEEAGSRGAITFARFMELALYCPKFGYYERPEVSPGRLGDYFTSVSVGNLFGSLLAFQFAEWLGQVSGGSRQLVEAGAHDGRLALDILRWLRSQCPKIFDCLQYWIIEPSAARRAVQTETLKEFGESVRWFDSWAAIPPPGVMGVSFSNELLDAMPVHRVGWDAAAKEWFEWGVSLSGDAPGWTRLPAERELLASGNLLKLPKELTDVLPDGFTTEIGRAAVDWWAQAARALRSGKLLAFDYGLTAKEFLAPHRSHGTLRAYHRHQSSADLLARPGEQDLTAQVNFTTVLNTAEAAGLRTETLQSQGRFLTEIVRKIEADGSSFGEWTGRQARQFQTLAHPEHLGQTFSVLIQSRADIQHQ